jgi:hypothetical protein
MTPSGNLSWGTTDDSLRAAFSSFGPVLDVIVMKEPSSGRSRGFGFVTVRVFSLSSPSSPFLSTIVYGPSAVTNVIPGSFLPCFCMYVLRPSARLWSSFRLDVPRFGSFLRTHRDSFPRLSTRLFVVMYPRRSVCRANSLGLSRRQMLPLQL